MEDEQAAIDAVLKFAVLALVIGALLGLATFVGVKMLGLNGGSGSAEHDSGDAGPSALPTTALSVSDSPSPSASSDAPSKTPTPKGITLSVSPGDVAPGQHINFTGSYPGASNVLLAVQRKEGGTWTAFADVKVPVRSGSFSTYIITSRTGTQKFRVYDTAAQKASNPVTVTVGG